IVHEDLEQIHEDDLEEMDLKWQLALLSIRARRYFQRTGKKITINESDTAGYDKTKVECFDCHKMGHFARECRSPRNQESRPRNQDSSKKTVNVEDTFSKAMVAIDGAWSYMADDEVPTNMALMAFSDSQSLPSEWNTHVVVWRNKADVDTMSIDDLYNNFKIVKQVKRTVASSSSSGSLNMTFLSSHGSTNEVDTASIQVNVVSTHNLVTGPGIVEVEVPSAFALVRGTGLKELPFSMTSHRA
nr:ribonuclease H-like domain-containing protein [Tanacetum cinerariifolium]